MSAQHGDVATGPGWDTHALRERFYGKCIPEPNSGCWLWEWAVCKDGYGKFQITNHGPGPKQFHVKAHRVSHFFASGEWPSVVRHKCDNPACVNPQHLEGGTQADNIHDMDARGRRPRGYRVPSRSGSKHHNSTTTERQATEVKRMLASGVKKSLIATRVGVSRSIVYSISNGTTWGWLNA